VHGHPKEDSAHQLRSLLSAFAGHVVERAALIRCRSRGVGPDPHHRSVEDDPELKSLPLRPNAIIFAYFTLETQPIQRLTHASLFGSRNDDGSNFLAGARFTFEDLSRASASVSQHLSKRMAGPEPGHDQREGWFNATGILV
jgi:hypothetical protein